MPKTSQKVSKFSPSVIPSPCEHRKAHDQFGHSNSLHNLFQRKVTHHVLKAVRPSVPKVKRHNGFPFGKRQGFASVFD